MLLSPHIKYTSTPLSVTAKSFDFDFVEELDMLLSVFPDDGTLLIILGDFSIHLEGTQAIDFMSLLTSFDLTPPLATHKAGKQLDLILTCNYH